jgi:hypothetical protein
MAKMKNSKNDLKLILYDDEVAMKMLLEEHEDRMNQINQTGQCSRRKKDHDEEEELLSLKNKYLVNLKSDDVTTVFASFYNILLEKMEGDKSRLFFSYLSFLCFEVKNYVGCLINSYNFVFSLNYSRQGTLYKNSLLQNYIDLSSRKLYRKFLDSPFWLSGKRIYDAYEYYQKLDRIEFLFEECVKHNIDYFRELSGSAVNFKILVKSARNILKTRSEIESLFKN